MLPTLYRRRTRRPRSPALSVSGVLILGVAGGLFVLAVSPERAAMSVSDRVEVIQTSETGSQRLTRLRDLTFGTSQPRGVPVINVDDRIRYQRITGFGAAMTDTSAWLLRDGLSSAARAAVLGDLFSVGGIHLNFLRVPMGASDFTKDGRPYSYDDLPPGRTDPRLLHFSMVHDEAYIVPALRQVLAINPHVEILADPWSPPAWMKANQSLGNQANRGVLLNSAYAPLARYFVKFIQAYARLGIPIASITPQNEPTNPTLYPGLDLDSASEAKLITHYLLPTLHGAGLHPTIYGGDVGVDADAAPYASVIDGERVELQSGRDYVTTLVGGGAVSALTGIAWHCYFGSPTVMSALHLVARRLDEIVDECSPAITPFSISELVISSMRNWASVVALWNLALDPHHGPVQPPNHGCPSCTGVVTVDEHRHTVSFSPAFFQLGQASAFVQPGAHRIKSEHFVTYSYRGRGTNLATPGLDDVAVLNPDGSKVLMAYNNSHSRARFAVEWRGRSFTYTLAANATVTFVWDRSVSAQRRAP